MRCQTAPTSSYIPSRVALLGVIAALLGAQGCASLQNRYRSTTAQHTASDVAYVEAASGGVVDDKHRLDIWSPAPTANKTGAPVVIFIHGGYWRAGDRHYFEPVVGLYGNVGIALAEQGIVTVVPSYRLFPQVTSIDAMLDDVAAVVRYTREHIAAHGGDPAQIVLAGHSAGGHLVALLATKPGALSSRGVPEGSIRGVVPISGIYDVEKTADNADPPSMKQELWDPLFGDAAQKREASSLQHFGVVEHPPLLFVIGEDDFKNCRRDYESAKKIFTDLKSDRATFVDVKGNTHEDMVIEIGSDTDKVTPAIVAFVRQVTRPVVATSATTP